MKFNMIHTKSSSYLPFLDAKTRVPISYNGESNTVFAHI